MFAFNPLKLPSVKIIKDDIIEKKQIIDDGIPIVVTTKKKKAKPGERLIKQYNRNNRNIDYDEIIERISNDMILTGDNNKWRE